MTRLSTYEDVVEHMVAGGIRVRMSWDSTR